MLKRHPEIFWGLLILLALLLAVWWIPGSGSINTDSYSVSFGGKKVLFRAMQRIDPTIRRSTEHLIPDDVYGEGRVLILGPARYPSEEEWSEIYNAVAEGTSVVFAVRHDDPYLDAGPFGVQVNGLLDENESPEQESQEPSSGSDEEQADQPVARASFSGMFESLPATSDLVPDSVEWQSNGSLELGEGRWEILVEQGDSVQAARKQFGYGSLTLIASDEIFSNRAMLQSERALLAWRILESTPSGEQTYFDESLNSSGVPKVVGLLFDPLFRPMTLQLVLIVILFGWMGSRRFGPVRRTRHGQRRSVVEHAQAVGTLYYQAGSGAHAVSGLHEFLKHELRRRYGSGFPVDDAERVARQADMPQKKIQDLFDQIRTSGSGLNSRAAAGRVLAGLSEVLAGIRRNDTG